MEDLRRPPLPGPNALWLPPFALREYLVEHGVPDDGTVLRRGLLQRAAVSALFLQQVAGLPWPRDVLELPTGTGKTVAAALLIARYNLPTLYLVPNKTLLGQTQRVLSTLLERPVGMLGDGQKDVQEVTESTIQTAARMSKAKEFRKYLESVPVLIGHAPVGSCWRGCKSSGASTATAWCSRIFRCKGRTSLDIRQHVQSLVARGFTPDIICIDDADLLGASLDEGSRRSDNGRYFEIGNIDGALKTLNQEVNCTTFTVSQARRSGSGECRVPEPPGVKKPLKEREVFTLEDVTLSSEKAMIADIVLSFRRRLKKNAINACVSTSPSSATSRRGRWCRF